MSRTSKPLPVDLDPDEYSIELIEVAEQRHALNALITEYDWLQLEGIAYARDETVSDLVRVAVAQFLSDAPERDAAQALAMKRLTDELDKRAWKQTVVSSTRESGQDSRPRKGSSGGRRSSG